MKKINREGDFMIFPGVTVVCDLIDPDSNDAIINSNMNEKVGNNVFWKELRERLSRDEEICNVFSFLPLESFHMTTIDLYTQARFEREENDGQHVGKSWENFLDGKIPVLRQLHETLSDVNHVNNDNAACVIKTKLKVVNGNGNGNGNENGVKRVVVISSGAILIPLELVDSQQNEKLVYVASKYGLIHKIPSEYHLTLAYRYRPKNNVNGNDNNDNERLIQDRLQSHINDVLAKMDKNHVSTSADQIEFLFHPPSLRYFNDMTKFFPWNADQNPFSSSSSSSSLTST